MFNETTGDLAAEKSSQKNRRAEPFYAKQGCNPEQGGGCNLRSGADSFQGVVNQSYNRYTKLDRWGKNKSYKDYYNEETFWNGKYPRRGTSDDAEWSDEETKAFGRTPFNQARSIDVLIIIYSTIYYTVALPCTERVFPFTPLLVRTRNAKSVIGAV